MKEIIVWWGLNRCIPPDSDTSRLNV